MVFDYSVLYVGDEEGFSQSFSLSMVAFNLQHLLRPWIAGRGRQMVLAALEKQRADEKTSPGIQSSYAFEERLCLSSSSAAEFGFSPVHIYQSFRWCSIILNVTVNISTDSVFIDVYLRNNKSLRPTLQ